MENYCKEILVRGLSEKRRMRRASKAIEEGETFVVASRFLVTQNRVFSLGGIFVCDYL